MDFINTFTDFVTGYINSKTPLIGYTNGLIIVALLLVIYWCLLRRERKEQFPRFCQDCRHLGTRLFNKTQYCKKYCNYHPRHRLSAYKSHYKKKV